MTDHDSTTPRVDALINKARGMQGETEADALRTRNMVAPASSLAHRDGDDDDLPGTPYHGSSAHAPRTATSAAQLASDEASDVAAVTSDRDATPFADADVATAADAEAVDAQVAADAETAAAPVATDDDHAELAAAASGRQTTFRRLSPAGSLHRKEQQPRTEQPQQTRVVPLTDAAGNVRAGVGPAEEETEQVAFLDQADAPATDRIEVVESASTSASGALAAGAVTAGAVAAAHPRTEVIEPTSDAIVADDAVIGDESDLERTQLVDSDLERTQLVEAQPTEVVETGPTQVVTETPVEQTTVIPVEERDRVAEREARAKRLGIVAAPAPAAEPVVPVAKPKRTTDKWHGSLALLILRLVTAALLFAQGLAHLSHFSETRDYFTNSILPQPQYWALGVSIAELLAAFLLVLGFATRFAGLLVVALAVIQLVFFVYGKSGAIFTPGQPGFKGDHDILMGSIGLIFLLLGAGGVALDRLVRRSRARAKEEKLLGNRV